MTFNKGNGVIEGLPVKPNDIWYVTKGGILFYDLKRYRKILRRRDPCSYCGSLPSKDRPHTMDHVIPQAKGGDGKTNLVSACFSCNLKKADRSVLMVLLETHHKTLDSFVRGCLCQHCNEKRDKKVRAQYRVGLTVKMWEAALR